MFGRVGGTEGGVGVAREDGVPCGRYGCSEGGVGLGGLGWVLDWID